MQLRSNIVKNNNLLYTSALMSKNFSIIPFPLLKTAAHNSSHV